MNRETQSTAKSLTWLLAEDAINPGVRYFALRDLLDLPAESPELRAAREAVMTTGPVPAILAHQHRDGYWVKPGYLPKYRGTMWSIIFLAQLGADGHDPRVRNACEHLFAYATAEHGGLSADGNNSGLIHCLQGNLCAALLDFGYADDARLQRALAWLARSITGAGIAPNTDRHAAVALPAQRQQRSRLSLQRQQPAALRLGCGQGAAGAEQGAAGAAHAGLSRRALTSGWIFSSAATRRRPATRWAMPPSQAAAGSSLATR